MKRFKILFLAVICLLACSINAKAEFFSDVIVTSPSGIWTDARAYSTLNAAITAVGSNQRTVVIVGTQTVTSLTVPSNVTLKFERDGMITNTGQLTIQTKNIIAENRRIFTGPGNIDFASGTILQSGWFNNIESAFAVTTNDTVTLIVSKPQTITASYSPGNNVSLQWNAPSNILTVNAGVTVSNIGQVTAGNYQLFAGAGNFRFRDGTNLNSSWFAHLRTIITWVSTNRVTLTLQGTLLVDLTDTIPTNLHVDVDSQRGLFSVSGGVTLTINGTILAGPYQWFSGVGTVVLPPVVVHYPEWYSSGTYTQATITAALTAIGTNRATLLIRPGNWVILTSLAFPANVRVKIADGAYFSGAGADEISFGAGSVDFVKPEWFFVPGTAYWTAAIQNAFNAAGHNTVQFEPKTYTIDSELLIKNYASFNINGVHGMIEQGSGTVIKYAGSVDATKAIIRINSGMGFSVDNIILDADDKAGYGLRLEGDTALNIGWVTSINLTTANCLTAGLYMGDAVGGAAASMVDDLVFINYNSYDNAIGVYIDSIAVSAPIFIGGWMGSPHVGATNKCAYHIYAKNVQNILLYGTQFTVLGTAVGVRAIHIENGAIQIYGGYNEVYPFLKVESGLNLTTVLSGVLTPKTSVATDYDIDYTGPGISIDGVRIVGGKMIVHRGTLTIKNSDIKYITQDRRPDNYENILIDPYMSLLPATTGAYWVASGSATIAAETTIYKIGAKSVKITAGGTYSDISQTISVAAGSRYAYLRGAIITIGAWVYCPSTNTQNQVIKFMDGIGGSQSNTIPKDNAWHYITVTGSINAAATAIIVTIAATTSVSDLDDVLYANAASLAMGYPTGECLLGPDESNGKATWNPGSIANGAEEAKDVTVTGAALGDFVLVSFSLDVSDLVLTAQVTAANTVTASLANNTGGAVDLGSGILRVRVIK